MNMLLWVLQTLLAVAFFAHGVLFLDPPVEMVEQMNASIPPALRIFIGVAEVLAAIGITLPGITRINPLLVSGAAAGLMMVMVSATILHTVRGEVSSAATTAVLLALATFVAYMRWKVKPIAPRTPPGHTRAHDTSTAADNTARLTQSGTKPVEPMSVFARAPGRHSVQSTCQRARHG